MMALQSPGPNLTNAKLNHLDADWISGECVNARLDPALFSFEDNW
jgi:hypothetical protein